MKETRCARSPEDQPRLLALVATAVLAAGAAVQVNADMYKPATAAAGGLAPEPVIQSISSTGLAVTVEVEGLGPYFKLQRKADLNTATWEDLGFYTTDKLLALTNETPVGILRAKSSEPNFLGAQACFGCHPETYNHWSGTVHARAIESLQAAGQDKNPYCLKCHTVGFGYATGYNLNEDPALQARYAGVQCENCHGPGGEHVASGGTANFPPATLAAEMCGGCHNGFHHPTFDEWQEAGHAHVSEAGMFNAGVGRMFQCGACHSGAVRDAVVRAFDAGSTNVVPPTVADANHFGQMCSTCHDPHMSFTNVLLSTTGEALLDAQGLPIAAKPAQLRNPIGSAKFMSFLTSTNPLNFDAQYDPDIQLCGQCHNERGATWNGTGRPPHHSPQYNILVGQVVDPSLDTNGFNGAPMAHGDPAVERPFGNPYQCTACHNRFSDEEPTPANPAYTGHRFEVQTLACAECHGFLDDPNAEEIAHGAVEFIQAGTKSSMRKAMAALDSWATNKIVDLFVPGTTNHTVFIGTNNPAVMTFWEFSTIGQLSPGRKAPPTAAQNRILKYAPEILQARFLLYMVEHDASYGVHNVYYVRDLLKKAEELAQNAPEIPGE